MLKFESKACRQCGKELVGRADKRFCDAYCRNAYNNQHQAEDEIFIKESNKRIRTNRRILKILCPEGKVTVRKEVLDHMGYDYLAFSSLFKSELILYYLVYDYAFAPIMDNGKQKALIVKRQPYMNRLGYDLWKKS